MVKYKLGVLVKGEQKIIDLDSIIKLKDLKSIDKFTSFFINENVFKVFLLKKDLLDEVNLKKDIVVVYKNNGKIKKIPVIYHDAYKLLEIEKLKDKLISNLYDMEFLEKLANYYSNGSTKYNKQGLNVNDIRLYLSDVRRSGIIHHSKMLDAAIEDLFKKAVFKIDKSTCKFKVNYRGLRDLALFIYKYELQKDLLDKQKNDDQTWDQPTLFDLFENEKSSVLSSDGDPDFPYNSEEEAMYKKYEEHLPNECPDYDEHLPYKR